MVIKRRAPLPSGGRRQWGSDRRDRPPMPVVAPPVSDRRITAARMAIVVTVAAWMAYVIVTVRPSR